MRLSTSRNGSILAGVTQLVECNLAKVDVAGSNPVSRSIPFLHPSLQALLRNVVAEVHAFEMNGRHGLIGVGDGGFKSWP